MLYLTKRLSKLTGTLLLLALLTSCEKQESSTEFIGKVIDLDTSQPVDDKAVYVLLNSGLSPQYTLTQQDTLSTKTNSEGAYTLMHEPKEWQVFYHAVAKVPDYLQVDDIIGTPVKVNHENKQDILMARASYLKLSINRTSAISSDKTLNVFVTYPYGDSPIQGQVYKRDSIEFGMDKALTNIIRAYYFKRTPNVRVDWEVNTDGSTEKYSQTVPLVEHDTTFYEINY